MNVCIFYIFKNVRKNAVVQNNLKCFTTLTGKQKKL